MQCCRRSGGNSGTAKPTTSIAPPPATVNMAPAAPAPALAPQPTSAPLDADKAFAPAAGQAPAMPTTAAAQALPPTRAGSTAAPAPAAVVPASTPGLAGASTGRRAGAEQPKSLAADFMAYTKRLEEVRSLRALTCCTQADAWQDAASLIGGHKRLLGATVRLQCVAVVPTLGMPVHAGAIRAGH
jgi:hypothetical protein